MEANFDFVVTFELWGTFSAANIHTALSALTEVETLQARNCSWTSRQLSGLEVCARPPINHNIAAFWANLAPLNDDTSLDDDAIHAVFSLVCCEEHRKLWQVCVREIDLVRKGLSSNLDDPTASTSSSGSSTFEFGPNLRHDQVFRFGPEDLKEVTFEFSHPSPSLAAPGHGHPGSQASSGVVSATRVLRIFSGGRKEHSNDGETLAEDGTEGSLPRFAEPATAGPRTPGKGTAHDDVDDSITAETDRLSLSSTKSSRSPGRHRKSESSRTRPDPGWPQERSGYARTAWASMRGDNSFSDSVAERAQAVEDKILNWKGFTDDRTYLKLGWVYVIRDPELDLVKIGWTEKSVEVRMGELESQCKALTQDWKVIEDPLELTRVPLLAFKLLETLVHTELAPHRWYFRCACRKNKQKETTRHQEWFEVTDDVAIRTVRLWKTFLLQNPYGKPELRSKAENASGRRLPKLQREWKDRLLAREQPLEHERHHHHDERLSRWKRILQHTEKDGCSGEDDKAAVKSEPLGPVLGEGRPLAHVPSLPATDMPAPSIEVEPSTPIQAAFAPPAGVEESETFHVLEQSGGCSTYTSDTTSATLTTDSINEDDSELRGTANPSDGSFTKPVQAHIAGPSDAESQRKPSNMRRPLPGATSLDFNISDQPSEVTVGSVVRHLTAVLTHKLPPIAERTILEDLVLLRWPLACAVVFGLHSPYVPAALSVAMWTVFLPFFVAELRGWY